MLNVSKISYRLLQTDPSKQNYSSWLFPPWWFFKPWIDTLLFFNIIFWRVLIMEKYRVYNNLWVIWVWEISPIMWYNLNCTQNKFLSQKGWTIAILLFFSPPQWQTGQSPECVRLEDDTTWERLKFDEASICSQTEMLFLGCCTGYSAQVTQKIHLAVCKDKNMEQLVRANF